MCSSSEALAENELNHLHLRQHHLHQDCEKRKIGRLFLRMLTCFLSRNIYHICDYHSVTSAINEYNYSRARNCLEPNLHFSIVIKYILNKKKRLLSFISCDPFLLSLHFTSGQHRVLGRLHQPIQQLRAQLPFCPWWRGSGLLLLLRICVQQHQGPPTSQSDTQPPHQWLTGDDPTKSNESPPVLSPGHLSGNTVSYKKGLNVGSDQQGRITRHFCVVSYFFYSARLNAQGRCHGFRNE